MTPVTLVMAYYKNAGMLREQFANIRALPAKLRDLLHVVIVDDGSPVDRSATPEDIGCPLQIWRIVIDVRWNQDAARNIGVHHAETDWLLLTDMDHLAPQATWERLLLKQFDRDVVYRFSRVSMPELLPYKPHPNSWFLNRKLYERIGGYDESFAGLYGTDAIFRDKIAKEAKEIVMLKEILVRYPRDVIPDASTTDYLRKQPEDREGLAKMREAMEADPDWKPKRLSFPYIRVA